MGTAEGGEGGESSPPCVSLDAWMAMMHRAANEWRDRSSLHTPSTPPEDGAPSASLDRLEAQAAPTHPGAPSEQRGGVP